MGADVNDDEIVEGAERRARRRITAGGLVIFRRVALQEARTRLFERAELEGVEYGEAAWGLFRDLLDLLVDDRTGEMRWSERAATTELRLDSKTSYRRWRDLSVRAGLLEALPRRNRVTPYRMTWWQYLRGYTDAPPELSVRDWSETGPSADHAMRDEQGERANANALQEGQALSTALSRE